VAQRPETFVKLAKGSFNGGLAVNVGRCGESLGGIRKRNVFTKDFVTAAFL